MVWNIGGTILDMGVSEDTKWIKEPVREIQHVPGSSTDLIQGMGNHSAKRDIEGVTKSATVKSGLDALIGTVTTLVDGEGHTSSVWLDVLQWQEVKDVTNLTNRTHKFKMTFIQR